MRRRFPLVAAVVALVLAVPAAAQAQQMPRGRDAPALQGGPPSRSDRASGRQSASRELPATGAEPGILALIGAGLLMMGFGLRLRLPGA